jgi:protein-disulfide isomerase
VKSVLFYWRQRLDTGADRLATNAGIAGSRLQFTNYTCSNQPTTPVVMEIRPMKLAPAALILVLGCSTQPSRLDDATATASPPTGRPTTPDDRLARLEHRLDKVAAALDKALGPAEPDQAAVYALPIDEQDPIEGPRAAKITIVEGYDFLCPYCLMANPVVDKIRAKYPDDVRVVSKYLVVHGTPAATAGTYACAAAKQGKFAEMKTALWSRLWTTENGRPAAHPEEITKLDQLAATLGLDAGKLATDVDGCKQWLQSGERTLSAVGVHGTPAFFVNGRPLRDRSFEGFDKLIAQELVKANRSGIASADYYDREIVAKGLTQVKGRFAD